VALAIVDGPAVELDGPDAYRAARADLLRWLGRSQASRAAYNRAIDLAGNTAEVVYLTAPSRPTGAGRDRDTLPDGASEP
jgi:RNA polymerase sigma-70 factor, ECF subfamily